MRRLSVLFLIMFVLFSLTIVACSGDDEDENSGEEDAIDGDDDNNDDAVDDDDDDNDDDNNDDDTSPGLTDPGEYGPYAVGVTTRVFEYDTFAEDEKSIRHRPLLTEMWYPILPADDIGPHDTPIDLFGKWGGLVEFIFNLLLPDDEMANMSIPFAPSRDVPIAPGGPFPVVLYSHGNASIRFAAHTTCEHLASRGFIVIAPDHPGNAFAAALPDRLIIYNPLQSPADFLLRQEDMIHLLDVAEELNADDPLDFFTDKIDVTRAALVGHSFGGNTVLEVFRRDPRFSACVAQAGPDIPIINDNMEGLLTFVSLEDHTLSGYTRLFRLIWRKAPPPRLKIEFYLGGHYTYTDACSLTPSLFGEGDGCGTGESVHTGEPIEFIDSTLGLEITNRYTTAWLEWRLLDLPHLNVITQNLYPEHIDHKVQLRE
ncbi:MAG: alpha/beta fold hydrolase [Candidatus Lernaella stagnicola]|nr:alpha/beta fold hydrolase [Candidatus Lernaella stagnicola]